MGKIADRFARRKAPSFAPVQELVKAARAACADPGGEADESLEALLEKHVTSLSPEQLDRLLADFSEEVSSRVDVEELIDKLHFTLEFLIETPNLETSQSAHLVAIPTLLAHEKAAWEVDCGSHVEAALERGMLEHGIVAEGSRVRLLPQMLPVGVAAFMLDGALYRVSTLLAQGRHAEALAAYHTELQRLVPGGLPQVAPGSSTMGVMMAVVLNEDFESMTLENEYLAAAEEATTKNELEEAVQDCAAIRARLEPALTKALGAESVTMLPQWTGWYDTVTETAKLQRLVKARQDLGGMQEACGEPVVGLTDVSIEEHAGGFTLQVPVLAQHSRQRAGTLEWEPAINESPEETMQALMEFLRREGQLEDDAAPGHPAASRRLH